MSQACIVCSHPASFEINEALIMEKRSNRRTAAQYGVTEQAIRRHRQHIPLLLIKASQPCASPDLMFMIRPVSRLTYLPIPREMGSK